MASQAVRIPSVKKNPQRPPARPSVAGPVARTSRAAGCLAPPRLLEGFGPLYHKALVGRQIRSTRPLLAAIVLLAHRMGAVGGGRMADAVTGGNLEELHALSCEASKGIEARMNEIMLGICGDSFLSDLGVGFQLSDGRPVLAIEGGAMEAIEIPVRAMPDGLGRLVYGCVSAITGLGLCATTNELEEMNYRMGMIADACLNFKRWGGDMPKPCFNEWCESEVDGELAELICHYDDFDGLCTELKLHFDDIAKKPQWMACPPSLEEVRAGFGQWKGSDSQNPENPWCRFIERTLDVVPPYVEWLRLAGDSHYADVEDCIPVGYSRIVMLGNHGEYDFANDMYEDMMNGEEPIAAYLSLLPVALPWTHARMESLAAAQGLLNLAVGCLDIPASPGDSIKDEDNNS